ncbi:hypothetical protein TNCV_1369731 [Trichonephila clavipes]|nr:hypothetical protein TNCV_1369731 [Trichonephila clavipes]
MNAFWVTKMRRSSRMVRSRARGRHCRLTGSKFSATENPECRGAYGSLICHSMKITKRRCQPRHLLRHLTSVQKDFPTSFKSDVNKHSLTWISGHDSLVVKARVSRVRA